MNEDGIEGAVKNGLGKVERVAGDALDNPSLAAKGAAKQVEGNAQAVAGKAQDALNDAAEKIGALIAKLRDQANDLYGQAQDRAHKVADQVDPYVHEKPYQAAGVALAVGLLAGLLIAGRGPRVIVVKPRV
jgi:ElaB/YqjD/DUF883 family membrane-anchored ribosome-binding protein